MKINGGCHCGFITYEAEVDPNAVGICHCTDCQALTGSAYRVFVPAPAQTFELLSGQPKIYIKTAQSGNPRAQGFCANCGSPLYSCAPSNPPDYILRTGTLDQRAALPPRRQIWCSSALPWSANLEDIPPLARQ